MPRSRAYRRCRLQAALLAALMSVGLVAAELRKETVEAFEKYVSAAETEIQRRTAGEKPFLRISAYPAERRAVLAGEVPIEQLKELPDLDVPHGMIHDWVGSVLIKAAPDDVLAVLRDYNRHREIYPEVIDSRTIESSPERLVGFLRLKKTKVITVVLDTEHEIFYQRLPHGRWYIYSRSTKINEISDFGKPDQRALPPGEGHGFLWRLYAYWFLEPVDGGTIAECRAISLTRDIPFMLSWIVKPFVTALPRESLTQTLAATRDAVVKKKQQTTKQPDSGQ